MRIAQGCLLVKGRLLRHSEKAFAMRSSGRPRDISNEHAGRILCAALSGKWSVDEIARMFDVSRVTVWEIKNPRPGSRFWGIVPRDFDPKDPLAALLRRKK